MAFRRAGIGRDTVAPDRRKQGIRGPTLLDGRHGRGRRRRVRGRAGADASYDGLTGACMKMFRDKPKAFAELGRRARFIWTQIWEELVDDRLANGAAVLAFYMMLALFPTAIFGLSSLQYLPIPRLQEEMFELLQEVLPG